MNLDLSAELTMKTLLEQYPGARRALFSAFHIGGCQSCAYDPEDRLDVVCQKNEIALEDAIKCLQESHTHDQEMLISPAELATLIKEDSGFTLLDTRTREEFEAISLPGAQLMTQELQTAIFADKNQDQKIILIDHQGRSVLDHCAWFRGHELKNTFGVDGGIDRYAKEIDSSIPRYRLEMD
ncbi:rhodanese-like domain-containing protein [Verrucomicrobiaceae bacterium 227]